MSEWPYDETKPIKFALTTLPRRMSKKQIVRTLKERWRTELAYEELKGKLGLDHYEGRSFPVAQVLSYLKSARLRLGLLITFKVAVLRAGVRRVVLSP
ncbi:GxxExxY protein [Sorangium cellulosum]|uniref:GxxExxY protein n=1 Tax=Sorangium cellulosum TaxID=56 RepID=UPI0011DCA221|nr:GxxExxY protein [Sorangium cellulosum]